MRRGSGARCGRLLVAGLLLTACGVQPQSDPQPVPGERLPRAAPSASDQAAAESVRVWGVRDQRLVPVFVPVVLEVPGADLAPRVQALLALADSEQGATAIPRGTRLVRFRREGDVVRLAFSGAFADTPERQMPLALAQLVFTVTEVPGVRRARIEAAGRTVPLVDGSGVVVQRPLERADFTALGDGATD